MVVCRGAGGERQDGDELASGAMCFHYFHDKSARAPVILRLEGDWMSERGKGIEPEGNTTSLAVSDPFHRLPPSIPSSLGKESDPQPPNIHPKWDLRRQQAARLRACMD
uniref:Carboxylesterase n=1 Tax=Panagrellus redivivus TaxID=6233 RepID=A0A7E4ZTH8_PANRE